MHHDAKLLMCYSIVGQEKWSALQILIPLCQAIFSDLGDMIRSMVCSEDETCTDFERITIRSEFYEAIVSGYLEIMGEKLTTAEKIYSLFRPADDLYASTQVYN